MQLKHLMPKWKHIAIVLVLVTLTHTANSQDVSQIENLNSVEPVAAPEFDSAQWINNPSADDEFLKGKVLVVNFWATWCPPCVHELPTIQKLWASLDRNDFEVVAVNVGETQATVKNFLNNFDPSLEFAIVLDPDLKFYKSWNVRPIPTTYIVDRSYHQRYRGLGEFDFVSEQMKSLVQQLIEE
ncbi:MAG: TlpA disulfide reductase family protein [Acidiferrobacterales bacterium]|nr:TlpA disulfide reductase family protein [Acidiferrobacterales bacterium]